MENTYPLRHWAIERGKPSGSDLGSPFSLKDHDSRTRPNIVLPIVLTYLADKLCLSLL
jgi:hypothetical protein